MSGNPPTDPGRIPSDALGLGAWLLMAAFVVIGFLLTVLAAFDVRVFGEETVVIVAVGLALVCAAAAGATITAFVVEWLRPNWTAFESAARLWFLLAGGLLTLITLWGAWWLLHDSGFSSGSKVVLAIALALAALAGAGLTLLAANPRTLTGGGTIRAVWIVNAGVGLALGVFLAVAPVIAVSGIRTHRANVTLPDPPRIEAEVDRYLALGDSYSAGEGIEPYLDGTQDVEDGGNRCHRSAGAYSQQLEFAAGDPDMIFVACSGAVTADLFEENGSGVPAQVDRDHPDPEVDLVTLTMGGNDVAFSGVVRHCLEVDDCTDQPFDPDPDDPSRPDDTGEETLDQWALREADALALRLGAAYTELRALYPEARIVVLGYPYLFPGGKAGISFSDCDTILRRASTKERVRLRELQDVLTDGLYGTAVEAGVEFVSPVAVWDGHEPCGDRGQYTNAVNPIVFDGSFHPNRAGQRAYATLLACYLDVTEKPANGARVLLPWENSVTDAAPAPGSLARPVPCPEAAPDS